MTKVEHDNFYEIKRTVAHNTLLTYPNFNETFKIHTNTSAFQLGAVITKKEKLIAFYRIKVADAQQWYTTAERELLRIFEHLKEFRTK